MKYLATLLLVFFISFQFSTSLSYLLENGNNVFISICDQDDEDENSKETKETKETKEIKSDFTNHLNFDLTFLSKNNASNNFSFYIISKYNLSPSIIILPPEII